MSSRSWGTSSAASTSGHEHDEIRNDVAVQSVSFYDSELRLALARRIFGDVRFVHYAHRAHPPIRILVDRGRVTLAGAVASPVEQAVLGHIARGFLSFGVDNRLVVDGDPPKAEQPAVKAS